MRAALLRLKAPAALHLALAARLLVHRRARQFRCRSRRSFLRSRYPLEATERVDLLQQAAEWYEQNGALDDALTCLIRADDPGPLADRLRRWGSSMLTAGLAAARLRSAGF